jgi:hypothetical protein
MPSPILSNSQESQIPEGKSLEERFGVQKKDEVINFDSEKTTESSAEKSASENDSSYQNILSKVKSQNNDDDDGNTIMQDASNLHQQTDRESQITHLIDLATTKGVGYAVKVAQKTEDYYVLDQLHDRLLADDLHDALMSHGLIEEL